MSDKQRPTEPGSTPPPTPPPSANEGPKQGWVDRLATRSAGLPLPDQAEKESKASPDKTLGSYAGLGLQFALTVAIFAWFGWWLDKKMGWSPWGLIGCSAVAFVGNFYLLVKDSLRDEKSEVRSRKSEGK